MESMNTLERERLFHDQQAQSRSQNLANLFFSDESYLNHESWIAPAMTQLGDVKGLRVLDFGCGHGMAGVVLAEVVLQEAGKLFLL